MDYPSCEPWHTRSGETDFAVSITSVNWDESVSPLYWRSSEPPILQHPVQAPTTNDSITVWVCRVPVYRPILHQYVCSTCEKQEGRWSEKPHCSSPIVFRLQKSSRKTSESIGHINRRRTHEIFLFVILRRTWTSPRRRKDQYLRGSPTFLSDPSSRRHGSHVLVMVLPRVVAVDQ